MHEIAKKVASQLYKSLDSVGRQKVLCQQIFDVHVELIIIPECRT